MGRLDEAREHLERLVKDAAEHGTVPTYANALHRLGKTYWALGRLDDARTKLTEALELVRRVGVEITESEILIDLGAVHRDAGDLDTALALVSEGMTLAITTKERYQQARALDALASVHDRAGRTREAEDHWRRAYTCSPSWAPQKRPASRRNWRKTSPEVLGDNVRDPFGIKGPVHLDHRNTKPPSRTNSIVSNKPIPLEPVR